MTAALRPYALAALLLAGCISAPVDDPVKTAEITLLPGTDAALSRTVSLRFDSIADSRCPANVHCIWAGSVAYHFTLHSLKGKEGMRLEVGGAFNSANLRGLRIALAGAFPGPVQAMGVKAPPHPVALSISRF